MTQNNNRTNPRRQHAGGIPDPLRERDQWIVTDDREPFHPREDWNTPDRQLSFSCAEDLAREHGGELAYALNPEDPFAIVDLDDVSSNGSFTEEALTIVEQLDTYTEISRSGTGLHIVCRGTRLPEYQETGELTQQGKLELFDASQYVILTGEVLDSRRTISSHQETGELFRDIQRKYLPERSDPVAPDAVDESFDPTTIAGSSAGVSAKEIYRTINEFAKSGSSEAKRARDAWQSSAGSSSSFVSASEKDLSLVSDLAFWCRNDAKLIEKCFRESSRMRDKWDEVHYSDGRTYGDGTIQTAIRSNYDEFSGNYVTK